MAKKNKIGLDDIVIPEIVETEEIVNEIETVEEVKPMPKTLKLIAGDKEVEFPLGIAIEALKQDKYKLAEGEVLPDISLIVDEEPSRYSRKYLQEHNEVKLKEIYLKIAGKGASNGWKRNVLIDQIILEQENG